MRTALLWAGPLLELAVVAGLIRRGRIRHAYLLPVFLVALAVSAVTVGVCATCNTWRFWIAKESVHAGLALALGVEVAWRVFRPLPGARGVAAATAAAVALLTGFVLFAAPNEHPAVALLPALAGGLACFYTGLVLTMMSFLIPADHLHAAVLLGLSPYMVLYAALWPAARDPFMREVAAWATSLMLVLALLLLLRVAWVRDSAPAAPLSLVRLLWPWR
jgi:hypothetical protein